MRIAPLRRQVRRSNDEDRNYLIANAQKRESRQQAFGIAPAALLIRKVLITNFDRKNTPPESSAPKGLRAARPDVAGPIEEESGLFQTAPQLLRPQQKRNEPTTRLRRALSGN